MSSPVENRYGRAVLLLMGSYAPILFGVTASFRHGGAIGPLAAVTAVLPGMPIVGLFALMR